MNKTAIFLGIILLFVLLAGGVYFFVFRTTSTNVNTNVGFNPDGTPITIPRDDTNDFVVDSNPTKEKAVLTHIHEAPVAGAVVRTQDIEITVGSTTEPVRSYFVSYVDKQTGHVFSYNTETDVAERVSNTTFPGIQEVNWFTDKTKVVFRYINSNGEIETYLGELKDGSLIGSYLSLGLPAIQTFKDSLLSISTTDRGSEGYMSDSTGKKETLSFESQLLSITIPAIGDSFIAVLTKPVSSLAGALYFYEKGVQKRILGGINGLTANPNEEGDLVLYSESSDRSFETSLHDRESNITRALPLATLPEKCTWGSATTMYCMVPEVIPPANYPENWYQGIVSFTDSLWRIDTETGVAKALAFFDESGPFDGVNLSVDEDEEYLTFINRRDGSLWGFDL